jgi:hypothetical protein
MNAEEQQRAEHMAGVESAMQTARWSIPVDLAINAHADALAFDGAPFPDLEISGDHRPRLGRHYSRGEGEVDSGHE